MTEQDVIIVEQLLERNIKALNAQDIDGILANQQPDAELVIPGGVTLRGHEQLRQYTEALWAAFPNGAFSFAGQLLTDDAAAVELVFTGTNTGPLTTPNGVIPPTGRHVTLRSASILRFEDGLIASEHAYPDQLDFMTQLGLMPPAPGVTSDQ
jgi:predicted ester cyclase